MSAPDVGQPATSGVRRMSVTWAVLVAVTVLSGWLGGYGAAALGGLVAPLVLAFAFAKAWVVGREFMDLRSAPRGLRLAFDAWVLAFATACCALAYL